jgi:hypothetical protein
MKHKKEAKKRVKKDLSLQRAKRRQKKRIARLLAGDANEQNEANVLDRCNDEKRCNHPKCYLCARSRAAEARIESLIQSSCFSESPDLRVRYIEVSSIEVVGKRRRADEKELRALTASMKHQGLHTPIAVRPKGKKFELLAGWRRFQCAKQLGWDTIPCFLIYDKTAGLIWKLAENL